MSGSVVRPDTLLEELPYNIYVNLEESLNRNDKYLTLARNCNNWNEECIFSNNDLSTMKRSESPAKILMARFQKVNLDVCSLQKLLMKCKLYDIYNILVTNDRMKITSPKDDVRLNAQLGEVCELSIKVEGSPLPVCQWFHNYTAMPGQTDYILIINNFGVENEGSYWCQLTQEISGEVLEKKTRQFILTIPLTPPSILSDLTDITVHTHEDLVLEIKTVAHPAVKVYSWYKDDKFCINTTEPQLRISKVDEETTGKYNCLVQNGVLPNCISKRVAVTVKRDTLAPSVPEVKIHPCGKVKYSIGDSVNLRCTAKCRHPVTFTCYLNNIRLTEEENTRIRVESSLGEYTCQLNYVITENSMGINWEPLKFRFEAESKVSGRESVETEAEVEKEQRLENLTARNKLALLVGNSSYAHEPLLAPYEDVKVLAKELVDQKFRVMKLTNLKKADFEAALNLFSNFVQKGDYVVFYFAGHGFSNRNDYMIPVDAPLQVVCRGDKARSVVEQFSPHHCISVESVTNILQKAEPALLFSVYDMCRRNCQPLGIKPTPYEFAKAGSNSFTLFATSENYSSYEEVDNGMSLLMQKLKSLVKMKIPVVMLGAKFLSAFGVEAQDDKELREKMIPSIKGDLSKPRSLTDVSNPHSTDTAEGGKLMQWEALGSVGGKTYIKMVLAGTVVTVGLQCYQDQKCGTSEVTWIISNCVKVEITLSNSGSFFNASTVDKEGLTLDIRSNMLKQITQQIKGAIQQPVCFRIPAIQSLKNCLLVELTFTNSKKEQLCKTTVNLGWPSLSKKVHGSP